MPTYVYGCDTCGNRFEKFQRFSDEALKVCPECEGKVRRIFQPAGIVFKGSGWHITDYKRAGKTDSDSAKAESTSKDEGAKASAGKDGKDGAAKPAAKESTAKDSASSSGSSDSASVSPAS
jgi:putative FmdB family regulatory protein